MIQSNSVGTNVSGRPDDVRIGLPGMVLVLGADLMRAWRFTMLIEIRKWIIGSGLGPSSVGTMS